MGQFEFNTENIKGDTIVISHVFFGYYHFVYYVQISNNMIFDVNIPALNKTVDAKLVEISPKAVINNAVANFKITVD